MSYLELQELTKHFTKREGLFGGGTTTVKAVDGVSLTLKKGEILGLVGESGCGKSTLSRLIMQLLDPTSGSVVLEGERLADLPHHEIRMRRRDFQMIFQDPYASLNPRMTVFSTLAEAILTRHPDLASNRNGLEKAVSELMERVGLDARYLRKYPHEFSGGQRQRIGIARAIALEPDLVICDEPISALDVSVQAQVVNMLEDLQADLGLTYLFITHDLSMVRHISDRIGVMYLGKIVELATSADLYHRPSHPYTRALLSAIPVPDPEAARAAEPMQGEIPTAINIPSGCRFRTRCPLVTELCARVEPPLHELGNGHLSACHFAEELAAQASLNPAPQQE